LDLHQQFLFHAAAAVVATVVVVVTAAAAAVVVAAVAAVVVVVAVDPATLIGIVAGQRWRNGLHLFKYGNFINQINQI